MNVVLCEKCGKPMQPGSKEVNVITIQYKDKDELAARMFDICSECAGELIKSLSMLEKKVFPESASVELEQAKVEPRVKQSNDGAENKRARIIELLKQGKSNKEIADTIDCTPGYVSYVKTGMANRKQNSTIDKPVKQDGVSTSTPKEPVATSIKPAVIQSVDKPVDKEAPVKKIDVPKVRALLRAGWSLEKIARTEIHCSVAEIKDALEYCR